MAHKGDITPAQRRQNTVRLGLVLLVGSVLVFPIGVVTDHRIPRIAWEALSFLDTGLFFFGALYLVSGLLASRR